MKNESKELPKIESLPQPPAGAIFSLQKVEKVSMPHPYCITPKHVGVAADQFSGMLTADAIRAAERQGAYCDICRTSGHGILDYDHHENHVTLFIGVPQNQNLNAVEGLHAFLFSNKETFIGLGIDGFAFPRVRKS